MSCQKCKSNRVASVSGKCSDLFHACLGSQELNDYVWYEAGIGGGDYMTFRYCLDCGQIQGKFPVPATKLEVLDE